MADNMWDSALKGYELGSRLGDKVTRHSAAKRTRGLEKELEGLSPEEYYDRLEKGLAEIGAHAERRGVDIADITEGLRSRHKGSVDRAEGRSAAEAEGLIPAAGSPPPAAAPPPIAPGGAAPLGAAPISPLGTRAGPPSDDMAIAPSPVAAAAPAAAPPAAAPPAASPLAKTWDQIHSGRAREELAQGHMGEGLSAADRARSARSGAAALAGPRTVTGDVDQAPGYRTDEEALMKRGDREGAQNAAAKNAGFRHLNAQNALGTITRDFETGQIDNDRLVGVTHAAFQNLPETGIDHIELSEDGKHFNFVYNDGRKPDAIENTPEGRKQMLGAFDAYSKSPIDYLSQSQQTRAAEIAASKAQEREDTKAERDKLSAGAEKFYLDNPKDFFTEAAKQLSKNSESEGGQSFGIKNLGIGADQGVQTVVVNGKDAGTVEVITKDTVFPQDFPEGDKRPGGLLVKSPDGKTTTLAALGLGAKSAADTMEMLKQAYQFDRASGYDRFKNYVAAMANIWGHGGDAGGASSGRKGPGEEGARRFPFKETDDYVKSITDNAGNVTGSNREKAEKLLPHLIHRESGGKSNAVSRKGATGLTQVMPKTSKDPGFGVKPMQDKSDGEYKRFATDYLTAMLGKYGGNVDLALAAYNAGPGQVDEWVQNDELGSAPSQPSQPSGPLGTSPPSDPSAPSGTSPADVKVEAKTQTEAEKAAAKAAADEAAATTDDAKREARARNPQTYRDNKARMDQTTADVATAEKKLAKFREKVQTHPDGSKRMTGFDSGKPMLSDEERRFEADLVAAVAATRKARDTAFESGKQDVDFWKNLEKRGQSSAERRALEKEFGNPQTDYVHAGKAAAKK